jgi:DNA-binding transcriptional LysR family regulator
MLSLDRLRALHAVATYGSVGAAAEALQLTPSAVSQQLAKLERETHSRLVERNGRGVRLTDAAVLLADHAADILSRVEHAASELEAYRGQVVGRLSIAAFATAARGLLPDALRLLAERYPELAVRLIELEPPESVRDLSRGSFDLAVVQDWHSLPLALPEGLRREPLVEDVADLVLPKGHPLAQRLTVDLRRLADEPWICSPPGAVCHDLLVQTIRSYDAEPRIVHVAAEYETQLALVAAGFGLAIVPRLGRGPLPDSVVARTTRPVLRRSVYAAWRDRVSRRPAIRVVVDALTEVAAAQ